MAGMTEMVAQFRERQEIVVAAADAIKGNNLLDRPRPWALIYSRLGKAAFAC